MLDSAHIPPAAIGPDIVLRKFRSDSLDMECLGATEHRDARVDYVDFAATCFNSEPHFASANNEMGII